VASYTLASATHNHPSGDPTPSRAAVETTRQIVGVAKLLGVAVRHHIIVGQDGRARLKGLRPIQPQRASVTPSTTASNSARRAGKIG